MGKSEVSTMGKLDGRTKWCYCVGATGRDMAYALVSMFLLTYIQYTMQLTTAQFAAISAIIVVCMMWDAFNDPLMGLIVEKSNLKLGKYKPWILLGVLANSAAIIILFTVRPSGWAFVVFFGIFYLLWGMTYTMNDIAYWGMMPSLTSDPKERDTLVTLMSIFCCVGQFSVAGLLPNIVAGNAVTAYRNSAFVIAGCFIAFQLLTFFGAKERPRTYQPDSAMTLKDMFRIIRKNDQLIVIGIACFLFNIANNLLIAIGMNFFYFEYGYQKGGSLVFYFTVMYALGTLLSQVFYPILSRKLSRGKLLILMEIVVGIGYLLFFSHGYILPRNEILLNAIGFVIFFAQGMINLLIIVMLNNTIEYAQVKTGERHESIISATRSFAVKLAGALNQGVVATILIVSGLYAISQEISQLEIQAGIGAIDSAEVLTRADSFIAGATSTQLLILRLGIVLIPLATHLASFLLIHRKYKIDEAKYAELVQQIEGSEK